MTAPSQGFWSDEPQTDDWLERTRLVKATAHLLKICTTPLVLGVYGSWGSGKTTFLRQLETMLGDLAQRGEPIRTVWFESWQYQFDDAPVLGLLHCIRKEAGSTRDDLRQLIMDISLGLVGELTVPYTTLSLRTLRERVQQARADRFDEQEARAKLRETFGELIQEARPRAASGGGGLDHGAADPRRLVVFIDDLDRCRPDGALRVLEALKLYLNHEGAVYVLAMDRPVVEAAIRQSSRSADAERQYLDKIVQIPFSLPPLTPEVLGAYVRRLLPKELADTEPILSAAGADNPRVAKRLVNALILGEGLVHKEAFTTYDQKTLAGIQVVQQLSDALYRELRRTPGLLTDLLSHHRSRSAGAFQESPASVGGQLEAAEQVAVLWKEHVAPNSELRQALDLTPSPANAEDAGLYFAVAARTSAPATPVPSAEDDPFEKYVPTRDRRRARLNSYARPTDRTTTSGHRYYEWMVFVDCPLAFRKKIAEVEYLLHQSFSPRVHVRSDPEDGFALSSSAWGNHSLLATVRYRDGHEDQIRYYVDLEVPWPTGDPHEPDHVAEGS